MHAFLFLKTVHRFSGLPPPPSQFLTAPRTFWSPEKLYSIFFSFILERGGRGTPRNGFARSTASLQAMRTSVRGLWRTPLEGNWYGLRRGRLQPPLKQQAPRAPAASAFSDGCPSTDELEIRSKSVLGLSKAMPSKVCGFAVFPTLEASGSLSHHRTLRSFRNMFIRYRHLFEFCFSRLHHTQCPITFFGGMIACITCKHLNLQTRIGAPQTCGTSSSFHAVDCFSKSLSFADGRTRMCLLIGLPMAPAARAERPLEHS